MDGMVSVCVCVRAGAICLRLSFDTSALASFEPVFIHHPFIFLTALATSITVFFLGVARATGRHATRDLRATARNTWTQALSLQRQIPCAPGPSGTSTQYHELAVHVLLEHWQPPLCHDGQLRLRQGRCARRREVQVGQACVESPNLQKAHFFIRTTVRLAW